MDGEIKKVTAVWMTAMAAFCYCRLVSATLQKGKWRLICFAPVFCLFAILPLYINSAFITAVTAFFITWLASFKLLLLAFHRGPLAAEPPLPLPIFIAASALPFRLRPKSDAAGKKPKKKLPLFLATEIPISAVLISFLCNKKENLHPLLVLTAYCCLVFLMIEILVELSNMVVKALLGMELEPPSDEPYLAASLGEFWGKRWNLTVNSLLRETVFRPVRAAAAAVVGSEMAAAMGVVAAFVVSGLMHELLFWYLSRGAPSWETTMFFVVHGVCVVAEFRVMGKNERRRRMPWFVTGPATVGFVILTSFWLFFPPLMRSGSDVRVVEELQFGGEFVVGKIKEVLSHSCNKLDFKFFYLENF